MASTYSPLLRTEMMGLGDQAGNWNVVNNNNIGTFLESAIAGTVSHNTAGAVDTTLSALNGTADEARSMVVKLTGAVTGSHNVICPTSSKIYLVYNATTGAFTLTFKTTAGTGVIVPQGAYMFLYCDGTNVVNPMTLSQLITPNIGAATGTSLVLSSTASATQYTSTVATGTAPLVVASTTEVANLHAATATAATTATNLSGGAVAATTISASGQITSTVATGTAPFVVVSTTPVANLAAATAAIVTTAAQPAITSLGTLTGITSTGQVHADTGSASIPAIVGLTQNYYGVEGIASTTGYGVVGVAQSAVGVWCQNATTGSPLKIQAVSSAPTTTLANGCMAVVAASGDTGAASLQVYLNGAWRVIASF